MLNIKTFVMSWKLRGNQVRSSKPYEHTELSTLKILTM